MNIVRNQHSGHVHRGTWWQHATHSHTHRSLCYLQLSKCAVSGQLRRGCAGVRARGQGSSCLLANAYSTHTVRSWAAEGLNQGGGQPSQRRQFAATAPLAVLLCCCLRRTTWTTRSGAVGQEGWDKEAAAAVHVLALCCCCHAVVLLRCCKGEDKLCLRKLSAANAPCAAPLCCCSCRTTWSTQRAAIGQKRLG